MPHVTRSRLMIATNSNENDEVPIDDILRGLKRKRIDSSYEEEKQDLGSTDNNLDYDKQESDDILKDPEYSKQDSDDDNIDSDYDPYRVVKKRIVRVVLNKVNFPEKMLKQEEVENDLSSDEEAKISGFHSNSYEEMIERKRSEKLALLKSMDIDKIKADFSEVFKGRIKKPRPVKKYHVESIPIRRSKRLAKIDIALPEESLNFSNSEETIPPELSFKDALQSGSSYEEYVSNFNIQEVKPEKEIVLYDRNVLKDLSLMVFNVCKVVPARVTAASWYPSVENLIVAAGDKYGNFGLWNIQDADTLPYLFRNHSGGITNMQFNLSNPVELISSSYDGTLRCCDLVKHMFTEVYNVSDETCCTYFDFLQPRTYLVSQKNGEVALVDRRSQRRVCEKRHACHDHHIRTVNVHPINKNVFVTADNKKSVRIWDLRKLQEKPVIEINHHERCINSAYFSPVTGNSILTTSLDDTICIFDSTNLTQDMKLKKMMGHNNCTGRWLSKFQATWLPNSDDTFSVGSMDFPRKIEIFDKDMNIYYTIVQDYLTTITSLHRFHPLRSALAAANSSGKFFIFT